MRLVIAEKPSVAQSLAAVLGANQRRAGYLEGSGWLVSWCLGHLAELADAAAYGPVYAKWQLEDLPILPESWRFTIAKDKREQFDVLRTLLRREDVTEVVNACDAGREGELIFRTVYALAGCSKPISLLWISSMEDGAIREGFAQLRPGRDYDGLHRAALCRPKADWLAGINTTQLFSLLYGRTLNIGRVVSPTLALIVQREANRTLGYTAQQTLDYLQALYEKKLCTFPRTDRRHLTDDMEEAGIPTLASLGLLRAVSPPHRYAETYITVQCGGQTYAAKDRLVLEPGWRAYGQPETGQAVPEDLAESQTLPVSAAQVKAGRTTPPRHYTEDMGIGKTRITPSVGSLTRKPLLWSVASTA
mgnify:FL=1